MKHAKRALHAGIATLYGVFLNNKFPWDITTVDSDATNG